MIAKLSKNVFIKNIVTVIVVVVEDRDPPETHYVIKNIYQIIKYMR